MTKELPEEVAGVANTDLSGKTVVVTGSTSGIGRETALALGRLGARVVVHGRDESKGEEVVREFDTHDGESVFVPADFSTTESVLEFADDVRSETDRLDVLVNNAGGMFSKGRLNDDGAEFTFAVNHLAPYTLTAELLDELRGTAEDADGPSGRVVVTASNAHRRTEMEFDALRSVEDGYAGFDAYCRSKLANILFTRELARRLEDTDYPLTANCLHPGAIPGSGFVRGLPLPFRLGARAVSSVPPLERRLFTTVREGAGNLVYLAASSDLEGVSGQYFADLSTRRPSDEALDDGSARRLWEVSEEITGAEYPFGSE